MNGFLPAHEALLSGLPAEREKFKAAHPDFVACLDRLAAVGKKTFVRMFPSTVLAEKIVFFGGIVCAEEFAEIVLLAANGQGVGALKPLRSLYERAVTILYLSLHPDMASRFAGYFDIEMGKYLSHAREHPILKAVFSEVPKDIVDEIEAKYGRAKKE